MRTLLTTAVKSVPVAYRLYNRMRGYRLHEPDLKIAYSHFGSDYGGWAIPTSMLARPLTIYSVGVGTDISFDLSVGRYCRVYMFDPTPLARAFIEGQVLPDNLRFVPIGLAEASGTMDFGAPAAPGAASFSRSSAPALLVSSSASADRWSEAPYGSRVAIAVLTLAGIVVASHVFWSTVEIGFHKLARSVGKQIGAKTKGTALGQ